MLANTPDVFVTPASPTLKELISLNVRFGNKVPSSLLFLTEVSVGLFSLIRAGDRIARWTSVPTDRLMFIGWRAMY
jgi:hypothetical protein